MRRIRAQLLRRFLARGSFGRGFGLFEGVEDGREVGGVADHHVVAGIEVDDRRPFRRAPPPTPRSTRPAPPESTRCRGGGAHTSWRARPGCRNGRPAPPAPARHRPRSGRARSASDRRPCRCRTCRSTTASVRPPATFSIISGAIALKPFSPWTGASADTYTRWATRSGARCATAAIVEPRERMPDQDEAIEAGTVGRAEHRVGPVGEARRSRARAECRGVRVRRGWRRAGGRRRRPAVEERQHWLPAPGTVAAPVHEDDRGGAHRVRRSSRRRARSRSPASGSPARRGRSCRRAAPVGSTTIAMPSSSRSNTPGAQNEQLPEPMHASRSIVMSSATSTSASS